MRGLEKERPKVAATTLGQPKTVEANGSPFFAYPGETCNRQWMAVHWRGSPLRRFSGKLGRLCKVLIPMLGCLIIQPENREAAA
jgi:hypothetical protein